MSKPNGRSRAGRRAILANNYLLKKYLTAEQQAEYIHHNKIIVKGSAGNLYIVPCSKDTRNRNPVRMFCSKSSSKSKMMWLRNCGFGARGKGADPITNMLAIKFQLEEDEEYVRRVSCNPCGDINWSYIESFREGIEYGTV